MAKNLSGWTGVPQAPFILSDKNAETKFAVDFLTKLKEFKEAECFCDLEIQVDDKKFLVHKAVLAAWSPVFALNLSTLRKLKNVDEAVVMCGSSSVFKEFLDFLYSGKISVSDSKVEHLMDLASNFRVVQLMHECEVYLTSSVTGRNFVSRYFIGLKYNLKTLETFVKDFVMMNISDINQHNAVGTLSPSEFYTFLSTGAMAESKRNIKFSLILAWVSVADDRQTYLTFLFSQLDWTEPVDVLLQEVSCTKNVFISSEFCLFQFLHTVLKHGHNLGQFASVYPRLCHSYGNALEDLLQQPQLVQPIDLHVNRPVSLSVVDKCDQVPLSPGDKVNVSNKEIAEASVNTDIDSSSFAEFLSQQDLRLCGTENEGEIKKLSQTATHAENITGNYEMDKSVKEIEVQKNSQQSNLESEIVRSSSRRKRGRLRKPKTVPQNKGRVGRQRKSLRNKAGTALTEGDSFQIKKEIISDAEVDEKSNSEQKCRHSNEGEDSDDETTKGKPKKQNARKARAHSKTSSSIKKEYRCGFEGCYYVTNNQTRVDRHVATYHKTNFRLKCHLCDFEARLMRDLFSHLKQHYTAPPYKCDQSGCTFECVVLRSLVYHLMEHGGELPYTCDICQKSFRTKNRLSCHRKLHDGRQFICDVCGKSFSTKGSMKQHRAIHFDQRPYLCDTCGYTTKHQSDLTKHRRIHTGDFLHCKFPGCNFCTTRQECMTLHTKDHMNIKNYMCQVCGKSFLRRGRLHRHELIHLSKKLFKCKRCEYGTSRIDRMKLHIISHGMIFDSTTYEKA